MCDWCGSVIISIKRIDVWLCVVVFMISFRCSIIFSFYTSHVHGTVKCTHFLTFFGCFASVFFITFSSKIDERLLNPFSQACDIVESRNIEHQFCISFILSPWNLHSPTIDEIWDLIKTEMTKSVVFDCLFYGQ